MLKGKIKKEDYEKLDEATKKFYKLEGDTASLQVEGMEHEDAIAGLRSALSKERDNAETAQKTLKKYEKLGKVDELTTQFDEYKVLKAKTGDVNADMENLKKTLGEQHTRELGARDQKISGLMGRLSETLIDAEAVRAIGAEKGSPELLMPHVHKHTKVVETDDGKYVVHVLGADGKRRFGKNGEGMTIQELVVEMKTQPAFGRAFDGNGASGSGTRSEGGGGGAALQRSKMSEEEKTNYISEHGLQEFQKLPK